MGEDDDMNHQNVLKVADRIANLPYRKPTFLSEFGKPNAFSMAAGSGAACCVSGWVCVIFNDNSRSEWVAQVKLGLNRDQRQALFRPRGWANVKWTGKRAAQVLRLMAAAGDGVTGKQIRAFWRNPWA